MAAGIVALALEANANLTWRDVQHVIVRTSLPRGNLQARDWAMNAAGLEFSPSYGFGLMDAGNIVRLAKVWETVPEQVTCTTQPGQTVGSSIKGLTSQDFTIDAASCGEDVKFIEHIHLKIDLTSGARRGDLGVVLKYGIKLVKMI